MYDVPGLGDPSITTKSWLKSAVEIASKDLDGIIFVINASNRVNTFDCLYTIALKNIMDDFSIYKIGFVFTHAKGAKMDIDRGETHIHRLLEFCKLQDYKIPGLRDRIFLFEQGVSTPGGLRAWLDMIFIGTRKDSDKKLI